MSAEPYPTAPPSTVVIFGATGDLAKRKLMPALSNLASRGLLPDAFRVLGIGRKPMDDAAYRAKVKADVQEFGSPAAGPDTWTWFEPRLSYAFETLEDLSSYESLRDRLEALDGAAAGAGYLFYLATPPDAVGDIVLRLGAVGLLREEGNGRFRRVIIEKPFGHDLASAIDLNRQLNMDISERQIYRIDHYLGKETVQNLLAFRFGNGIFEPIWNRRYIDHVQITVAETVGVEDRGGYYDQAGALRDMIQNHLLQLLALTAMEPPISFSADAVRDERVKALHAIHPWDAAGVRANVVCGQYGPGREAGADVPGYLMEPRVAAHSTTETFVALRLTVDNWRWAGVPFYLRTGKRLPARVSEIAIQFNRPPLQLFRPAAGPVAPNLLVMSIQPNEGISLQFQAKVPGPDVTLGTVDMAFNYADYFARTPETGYETLLYDGLTGDQTLFHRADGVEAGWRAVAPILELVTAEPDALLASYAAGTWGPADADALLARDGRAWRQPKT